MAFPQIDPLDWQTVQPVVDRLLAQPLAVAGMAAWLGEWSDLAAVLNESANGIQRAVSENTADREAEARYLRLVEEIMPQTRTAEQALRAKALQVRDYAPGPETAVLWRRFEAETALFRAANVPIETELAKLTNQYDKIVGALTISWDGVVETMPQAQLHLRDADRAVRDRAWRLIQERWLAERAVLDGLYLEMLRLRRQLAANAGLPDFRAYAWGSRQRFDYTPADCFTFHDAIAHEVVPAASMRYARLAEKLGLARLRPWDTDVEPYAEPLRPFQDVQELEAGVYRIFQHLDPDLAGYFAAMRDGWLDLSTRPNKAPGGYCESFPVSRRPYIFMSAAGTQDDVSTLLHESGHAFHFMESLRQSLFWNYNGPLEFSEVASMGMELLAAPYLARDRGGFYDEAGARRAYVQQLERALLFLPYMAVVDAFQHWIYVEAPANVTAAQLDARWGELWDRYMPDIDYEGLEAEKLTGWHRKLHIFQVPFYYVEYGLAQLGALQVWRNALADQAQALARYRAALALGYTRPLPELFQAAGARFAFDRPTLGELVNLINTRLAQLEGS